MTISEQLDEPVDVVENFSGTVFVLFPRRFQEVFWGKFQFQEIISGMLNDSLRHYLSYLLSWRLSTVYSFIYFSVKQFTLGFGSRQRQSSGSVSVLGTKKNERGSGRVRVPRKSRLVGLASDVSDIIIPKNHHEKSSCRTESQYLRRWDPRRTGPAELKKAGPEQSLSYSKISTDVHGNREYTSSAQVETSSNLAIQYKFIIVLAKLRK